MVERICGAEMGQGRSESVGWANGSLVDSKPSGLQTEELVHADEEDPTRLRSRLFPPVHKLGSWISTLDWRMHSDFSRGWDHEGGQRGQGHSTCWYPTSGQRPVLPTRELEGVELEDFVALGKSIALVQWH